MWDESCDLIGQKNTFQQTHAENFLVDMKQAGKQASGFSPLDRYFSFFWVVISVMYVALFILGKCLLYSYQLLFIFIEVQLYNFHVSR